MDCPVCGRNHYVKVIRWLSSDRRGKYVVWCNVKRKFETLYMAK